MADSGALVVPTGLPWRGPPGEGGGAVVSLTGDVEVNGQGSGAIGDGIPEPSTAGAFLRTNAGTWVPGQRAIGVTDGSEAAPGEVGEYIVQRVPAGTTYPGYQVISLATINLSPGDWDLSAFAYTTTAVGLYYSMDNLATNVLRGGTYLIFSSNAVGNFSGIRFNLTQPAIIDFSVYGATAGSLVAESYIAARRVR
jgi:hypothetical protein